MEAILVTFQEQVILRGVAIRKLREAEPPIRENENYIFLKMSSAQCGTASPWEFFFAAIERAADAPDRNGILKQLDEAERVLLTLAHIRHEVTTGVRVSYNDLRRSYFGSIEARLRGDADITPRDPQALAEPRARPRERRLANSEPPAFLRKTVAPDAEPIRQPQPERNMVPFHAPKADFRERIAANIHEMRERLQSALADWRVSRVLAALCLGAFAISMYLITSVAADYWHLGAGARIAAQPVAADNLSIPITKPPPVASPKVVASTQMGRIAKAVNVRAEPGGPVLSTLRRGANVAIVERNGKWVRIRAESAGGGRGPVVGWIYDTFLATETAVAQVPHRTENE